MLDYWLIAEFVLLGAGTGFLAGLLGIGGGMTMVPFLTMIFTARAFPDDTVVKMAIATSLTTILFTSISSVWAHYKRGAVRTDLLWFMGSGAFVGTFAGANFAGALKGSVLAAIFAVFVGYSAWQMLRGKKPKPGRSVPGKAGQTAVGSAIGFLSSLLGAGGGFITVPFLTWCNVQMHQAVATSAGMGFPIAAGGLIGYAISGASVQGLPEGSLGYIYLPALAILAIGSVVTAPLGAKAAHAMNVATLKKTFAILLFALAGYMLTRAF
jgi:uncharacterized membrane protein YfcA